MTTKPPGARRSPALTKAKPTKAAKQATPSTKLDRMIGALRSSKGASISDLMLLTGWQMHSVRGAIAGALKKKRGLKVISTKTKGERIYRIAGRT